MPISAAAADPELISEVMFLGHYRWPSLFEVSVLVVLTIHSPENRE